MKTHRQPSELYIEAARRLFNEPTAEAYARGEYELDELELEMVSREASDIVQERIESDAL